MACFDQKSCMNYHSPQDTNTQTTTVARLYDRDIVKIWKLRVQSNLFNKDKWYGGWYLKWIRIFISLLETFQMTMHLNGCLYRQKNGSMLVNNTTMVDQWVKSKQLIAALEILSV